MPRVSRYADRIAGVGASVSLNGTVLAARGTCASFLDPSRAIYHRQVTADRWKLEVYDLATQQFADVPYGERGANYLSARGGRWFAWVNGIGVYDATGTIWPAAGLAGVGTDGRGAIGQDGTVGFIQDYQGGHGLQLLTPDGVAIDLPDVAIPSLSIYDASLAVWIEGGQIRAYGRPDPAAQLEPVAHATVVKAGGEYLLLVTTNDRLWLRRWDRPVGVVVVPTPTAFAADACAVDAGTVRVVFSSTVGERPEDIDTRDIAVADLEDPITNPVSIPAIGRPFWCGWFVFGEALLPSNCALMVDADMLVRDRAGNVVAQYVASEGLGPELDLPALEAAIAAAKVTRPGVPTLCYWTRKAQAVRVPAGIDLGGVEAYRQAGEPLDAFEARILASVARLATAWLIGQCYTSNPANDPDLVALVPVYARIARDYPNVAGVLVFSAGSRASGWDDHPEVHPAWEALFAGITGTPILDPRSPIPVPAPTPKPVPKPTPAPTPAPSPVPSTLFPPARPLVGAPMKVFAKLGNKYTGVNPAAQQPKGGGEKFPVYHDRVQGGAWEEIELTPHDATGGFLARYVAADKALSMQPDGRLETRDPGTDGGYEVFYATTQPDGTNILYRIEQNGIVGVLMLEEVR